MSFLDKLTNTNDKLTVSVPENTTVYAVPAAGTTLSAIVAPIATSAVSAVYHGNVTTGAGYSVYSGAGGAGGAGYGGYSANGSSGTWTNYAYTGPTNTTLQGNTTIEGDATISGDLTIKGVKLSDRLDKIEERLGIIRMNDHLEEKWERLKALGEEYRKLEKELIEGEKIWDVLKK